MLWDPWNMNCDNRLWKFQFSGSVLLEKWSRTFRRSFQPSPWRVWPSKKFSALALKGMTLEEVCSPRLEGYDPWRSVQPSPSKVWPLKMKVGRFFEMSGSTYPLTQHSLIQDWNFHRHPCDNLRADVQGCSLVVNCEIMRNSYMSSLLKEPVWRDEKKNSEIFQENPS